LNPNGSTKHHHAQKEREAITEVIMPLPFSFPWLR